MKKTKQSRYRKLVKRFVILFLLSLTTYILFVNVLYAAFYARTASNYQQNWSMSFYKEKETDSLCIWTTLYSMPPYLVLPALKVKFIINGEIVPLSEMYVSLDYNEYSFDILRYHGDTICTWHNLDIGLHELEIIEVLYPENRSQLITFYLLEGNNIRIR